MQKMDRFSQKKCRNGRGNRSYQGMASAYIEHSAQWTEETGK